MILLKYNTERAWKTVVIGRLEILWRFGWDFDWLSVYTHHQFPYHDDTKFIHMNSKWFQLEVSLRPVGASNG